MAACGWTIGACGCGICWDKHTPATRELASALAINHMWAATGRRYGPCEITVLPCNPSSAEPLYRTFPVAASGGGGDGEAGPYLNAGTWHNQACGAGCTCTAACEIPLDGPVHSVVGVTVAGEVVAPAAYRVEDRHLLVRIDGECWPTCVVQGAAVPGFAVTYQRGDPIPAAVQAALERLACEYARACTGGKCVLPARITRLSRQGVDVALAELTEFADMLLTNIPQVDAVISATNPHRRSSRVQVTSPDLPVHRMVTASSATISPATIVAES